MAFFKQQATDMTKGNPAKMIMIFAVPLFIGNAFQMLYNTVDTMVVGRFVGPHALAAVGGAGVSYSVMLMLINGATHGINLMYTSMAVPHFARFGKTSFVTGAINSAVYVGSAISMYGVALITEKFGWGGTMLAWLIVAIVGFALCLPAVRLFVKLDNEEK